MNFFTHIVVRRRLKLYRIGLTYVEEREMPVDIMDLSKPAEDRPEKVSTCV